MQRTLEPSTFRRAMDIYLEALTAHESAINSLNVYPVPDGDTGTNLRLTQQAVVDALLEAEARAGREAVDGDGAFLARTVSRAALMGARGNSGVILSQVLRALGEVYGRDDSGAGPAAMLRGASNEADRVVVTPVEGTMLSVLRAAAEEAERVAGSDAGAVLDRALEAARAALRKTPEQLPELAEAGVVDAGGKGIVVLLDALRSAVRDEAPTEPVQTGPVGRAEPRSEHPEVLGNAFEVQMLVEAADEDRVGSLRNELSRMGESLVVVGGGGLFNVHVHTGRPEDAVEAGRRAGAVRDASVVDLRDAVEGCLAGQARGVRVAERQASALVAVAEGRGIVAAFRSLGATVVPGGPGNDPPIGAIARAVEQAPSGAVLVLPNHRNVAAAARGAVGATSKDVRVLEAVSIPAGLAAAAAFNPGEPAGRNQRSMAEAAAAVRSGEVVRAERDANTPSERITRGDWLGMVAGRAVSAGRSLPETALEVAAVVTGPQTELLTVVVGEDADPSDRDEVVEALRRTHPGVEVQAIDGGQPRYPFLIGAE
jgi:DAK2 domain fusion protein YloV